MHHFSQSDRVSFTMHEFHPESETYICWLDFSVAINWLESLKWPELYTGLEITESLKTTKKNTVNNIFATTIDKKMFLSQWDYYKRGTRQIFLQVCYFRYRHERTQLFADSYSGSFQRTATFFSFIPYKKRISSSSCVDGHCLDGKNESMSSCSSSALSMWWDINLSNAS